MAYSLGQRFSEPTKYFAFYDPGTYQYETSKLKHNKVPFLSKTPRGSSPVAKLWTHAIYDGTIPRKYRNISSFQSKLKRFTFEAPGEEDLEEILCRCAIDSLCECPTNEPLKELCQAKVKRHIFKGPCLQSVLDDESLASSRNDYDLALLNGTLKRRIGKDIRSDGPSFYDTRVHEFTKFYQGWKWSRRTSKRSHKVIEQSPGPADYFFTSQPTKDQSCVEKVHTYKCNSSKQLCFIEKAQEQNIFDGPPVPKKYNSNLPKSKNLKHISPKANKYPCSKHAVHPGPADHFIRRDFDPVKPPEYFCQAALPEPAAFGVKATRFFLQREIGASPATYKVNYKLCRFVHCPRTPFGSSALRFKADIIKENNDEEIQTDLFSKEAADRIPTWQFKSKTLRMKPLVKIINEPSPADLPPLKDKEKRSLKSQYAAPFYSSIRRFEEWHNWIPVHCNNLEPIFCNMEKPKCSCPIIPGPLFRAKRFPIKKIIIPAPNQYTILNGIETVLRTHNKKLADNIENQHTFTWRQPIEPRCLNNDQRETLMIQKCIALLEPEVDFLQKGMWRSSKSKIRQDKVLGRTVDPVQQKIADEVKAKPKMLRSFLYARQIPCYF